MKKSRINTEQRIINAVATLLLDKGFPEVGINSIARQAGCDKVLIYRYFGGLEGLLQRFADEHDLWWNIDEILPDSNQHEDLSLPQYLDQLLKKHIQAVQSRPLTQEIMAWEISDSNALTLALNRIRTERGQQLVKTVRQHFHQPTIDIGGILGIFGAAVNYLVIRTRHHPSEHATEEWWRLEQSISGLLSCQSQSHQSLEPEKTTV